MYSKSPLLQMQLITLESGPLKHQSQVVLIRN